MAASRINQRGKATVSAGSSVETDWGRDEEDAKPSLVTTLKRLKSKDQEFILPHSHVRLTCLRFMSAAVVCRKLSSISLLS
jgi:hypothetical protein